MARKHYRIAGRAMTANSEKEYGNIWLYGRDITWVHFRSKGRTIGPYVASERVGTTCGVTARKLKVPLLHEWDRHAGKFNLETAPNWPEAL